MIKIENEYCMMEEVDSPIDGIYAKGWVKLAPEWPEFSPKFWVAYRLYSYIGNDKRYYLGAGYSNLNIIHHHSNNVDIFTLQGYPYILINTNIYTLPARWIGCEQFQHNDEVCMLASNNDLLLINRNIDILYLKDVVADNLNLVLLKTKSVLVSGLSKHTYEEEQKEIYFSEFTNLGCPAKLST